CRASPSGTQAMISCAPISTPAAWGLTVRIPSKGRISPWDDRVRLRRGRLVPGGSFLGTNGTAWDHALSLAVNSLLLRVNATSVGHMRDREPCCKAGHKAPVDCRVSTRDRSALLYARAGWQYGPVSAVGTAREGMECCKRRGTASAPASLRLPAAPEARR